MLKAFWRVAPSVRFSFLAICDAEVFFFASDFRSRTSAAVHARRFFALFAIKPPFHERQFVSLAGVNEKPTDQFRVNRDPSVTIQMSSVTELHMKSSRSRNHSEGTVWQRGRTRI